MWQLPALAAGPSTLRLPLTDWAARRVVAALLAEGVERRTALVGVLAAEPPLALWALTAIPACRCHAPASLEALAEQLVAEWFARALAGSPPALLALEPSVAVRRSWAALAEHQARYVAALETPQAASADHERNQAWSRWIGAPRAWSVDQGDSDGPWPDWLNATPSDADELLAATTSQANSTSDSTAAVARLAASSTCSRWLRDADDSCDLVGPAIALAARRAQEKNDFATKLRDAKLAALKELAYGASHEINNPLANIATRAQTLLADERDPERRRKLATVAAQAFRAHEMITDLMLFARPPALRREPVELSALVTKVLDEFRLEADIRQVTLHFERPAKPLTIDADPTQLGVALHALIRNAVEACDSAGTITVELGTRAGEVTSRDVTSSASDSVQQQVWLVVRDTGRGFTPRVREHLFDPFFSGREAGRGLGFGLSKCWRIVTEHGGQVRAEANPAGGTCFTIELPVSHKA